MASHTTKITYNFHARRFQGHGPATHLYTESLTRKDFRYAPVLTRSTTRYFSSCDLFKIIIHTTTKYVATKFLAGLLKEHWATIKPKAKYFDVTHVPERNTLLMTPSRRASKGRSEAEVLTCKRLGVESVAMQ